MTQRDHRRQTRQEQYHQRQRERTLARQREIRRRQLMRGGLIGGGVLLVVILAVIISLFVFNGSKGGHTGVTGTGGAVSLISHPATGQTVDGLTCLPEQGGAMHIHQYLELYINGQRVDANPGIGIPQSAQCLYPLHVHDGEADIIHNESNVQQTFTLGQFFDIWGVTLSSSQVGQYKVDSAHKLVIEVFDQSGHMTTYTGDPHNLQLAERETIYVLYNSPKVTPVAWNGWNTFNG